MCEEPAFQTLAFTAALPLFLVSSNNLLPHVAWCQWLPGAQEEGLVRRQQRKIAKALLALASGFLTISVVTACVMKSLMIEKSSAAGRGNRVRRVWRKSGGGENNRQQSTGVTFLNAAAAVHQEHHRRFLAQVGVVRANLLHQSLHLDGARPPAACAVLGFVLVGVIAAPAPRYLARAALKRRRVFRRPHHPAVAEEALVQVFGAAETSQTLTRARQRRKLPVAQRLEDELLDEQVRHPVDVRRFLRARGLRAKAGAPSRREP